MGDGQPVETPSEPFSDEDMAYAIAEIERLQCELELQRGDMHKLLMQDNLAQRCLQTEVVMLNAEIKRLRAANREVITVERVVPDTIAAQRADVLVASLKSANVTVNLLEGQKDGLLRDLTATRKQLEDARSLAAQAFSGQKALRERLSCLEVIIARHGW
jgi:hypothetical protein